MTPTQQTAYLALAEAKSPSAFEAAITALEATVEHADPNAMVDDGALLEAFCRYARFVAEIGSDSELYDQSGYEPSYYHDTARRLLGWTSEGM